MGTLDLSHGRKDRVHMRGVADPPAGPQDPQTPIGPPVDPVDPPTDPPIDP